MVLGEDLPGARRFSAENSLTASAKIPDIRKDLSTSNPADVFSAISHETLTRIAESQGKDQ